MVGSRAKGMPGVFQLTNLEYLNNFSSDLDGMSVSEVIENMVPSEKVKMIKFLNKCGYKFFGLIKKYQIEFDHSSMRINGQTPDKVTMRKLKKIADDLIKIKENVIKDIQKSSINSDIKEYVIKYCKWAISHVERDFSTVHVGEKDGKEKEFTIKLWNRKDLITNLVQGN